MEALIFMAIICAGAALAAWVSEHYGIDYLSDREDWR